MNKAMLIGYVANDPNIHYYDKDQCVAYISLVTTESEYTSSDGKVIPAHKDWHNLVLFKSLAKYTEKYVNKGDKLYIEGRLRYKSFVDKANIQRSKAEVYVETLEWLSSSAKEDKNNIDSSSFKKDNYKKDDVKIDNE